MAEISRVALFGKLNPLAYKAIESATMLCKMRGNSYVELVHWFNQILQNQDSDLHRIARAFDVDGGRLARDFAETLDRLPAGATSISDLSPHVEQAVERGWVYSTLLLGDAQVRTGHLVVGLLKTPALRNAFTSISREFDKIKLERLTDEFQRIVSGSPEEKLHAADGSRPTAAAAKGGQGDLAPAAMGKQQALSQYSIDLTERARNGEIDPIVGRDEEIRQVVDILMRRRQNNPILTGEAGVGKTAVVEGFALRIVQGDVPPQLKDVTLRTLDIGLLQAGASVKGEFENRLRQVIEEVQTSEKPIILFVDEAHTLIGAGGAVGTGDAANLLKPALARGTLRTIAATTWAEYKKYIEKDPALTRRFQVVQVAEPSEEKAIRMMRGMAGVMEAHHRVQVLDEAIEAAVKLSHRYIPARQLPDKSVSLLDTACARVAVSLHATPPAVDDSRRRIDALETELKIINREAGLGLDTQKRKSEVTQKLDTERTRVAELEACWKAEKELVEQLIDIRAKLRSPEENTEAPTLDDSQRRDLLAELRKVQSDLEALQQDAPLMLHTVDSQAVASVVADWTGIPVGRMVKNEIEAVMNLAETLNQRVIGQRHGLDMIAKRVQTSRAGLDNPNKPIGVFMLAGPSGVGKTETALALAEAMYGGEHNVITINMSEFQEAHTVSTLKGAPPGYVGYGEGGVLTEAVRRKPYSVVLLDEVEKAHPDVHEIFFQVFDKGWMEDGEGRVIDFKNTLILLTSNVGSDLIMNMCDDPNRLPEPEIIAQELRKPLLDVFPAALLGRIVVIPYYPLSDEMVGNIARLQLGRIAKRVKESHGAEFSYSDEALKLIVDRCTELESGGRMIDAILTNSMLPAISMEVLYRMANGQGVNRIVVTSANGQFNYNFE